MDGTREANRSIDSLLKSYPAKCHQNLRNKRKEVWAFCDFLKETLESGRGAKLRGPPRLGLTPGKLHREESAPEFLREGRGGSIGSP